MRKIYTDLPCWFIHTVLYLYRIFAFILGVVEPLIKFLKKTSFKVYFLFFTVLFVARIGCSLWTDEGVNWIENGVLFAVSIFAVMLIKYILFPLLLRFCKTTRVNIRTYFSPFGFKYVVLKRKDICNYYSEENQGEKTRNPDNFSFKNSWK